jgi:hypothetical protein
MKCESLILKGEYQGLLCLVRFLLARSRRSRKLASGLRRKKQKAAASAANARKNRGEIK